MKTCKHLLLAFAVLATFGKAFAQDPIENLNLVVVENSNLTVQNPTMMTVSFMKDGTDTLDIYDFGDTNVLAQDRNRVHAFTLSANGDIVSIYDSRPYIDHFTSIPLGFNTMTAATVKLVTSHRSVPETDSSQRPTYTWIRCAATGAIYPISATDTVTLNLPANTNYVTEYQLCFGPAVITAPNDETCFGANSGSITVINMNNYNWDLSLYHNAALVTSSPVFSPVTTLMNLAAGNYYVVTKVLGVTIDSSLVTVNPPAPVTAAFTSSSNSVNMNEYISFTNASTNGTSYSWDFGDGNTDQSVNTLHAFSAGGSYPVTLTVTGDNGCQSSFTDIVYVSIMPSSQSQSTASPVHTFQPTAVANTSGLRTSEEPITVTVRGGAQQVIITQEKEALNTIEVITLDGRVVASTTSADASITLAVPSSGIYIVRVMQGATVIENSKIMIN